MSHSKYLQEMIAKAVAVMKNAYVPSSHFPVGACLRTLDDSFYVGCNLENASFPLTICAESAAIANMIAGGHRQVAEIIVLAENVEECPPCGACRQRLHEFSIPETLIHLCSKTGVLKKTFTMEQLLPGAFKLNYT